MNISNQFTLITIVSGRANHLHNLLEGVRQSSIRPDEIIIVGINETPSLEAFKELPIRLLSLEFEGGYLPVAKARNYGASQASFDHLIFLDVDCIPSGSFFEQILLQGVANPTLIMGTPRYLNSGIDRDFKVSDLEEISCHHPHRPEVNGIITAQDYMLFWSLAFYVPKQLFEELGGFDEKYTGYGAEDTDLSLKLRETTGFKLMLSEATVYHQQHPVYSPPVHQIDSIIQNAKIFYAKWKFWVMDNWLAEFQKMGLIHWELEGNYLEKIKEPTEELKAECLKEDAPFM